MLIDGDQYLYRSTVSAEKEVKWDEENWILHANEEEAYDTFQRSVANEVTRIQKALGCEPISKFNQWLAFSLGDSFRLRIHEGYKGSRKGVRKPLCYWTVKDRLVKEYRTKEVEGLEADDIMGIWSTSPHEGRRIIVSADKDMQTIPGHLWRGGDVLTISETEANRFFMYQTLTGDVTDGYPGLVGVGDTKATRLLEGLTDIVDLWKAVSGAYVKSGSDIASATTMARCARILRASDWDSASKQIKLWEPPSV